MLTAIKNYVKSRGIGYWVSLGTAVLMLVLIIIYPTYFYWSQYWEPRTLVFLIVGLVAGIGLIVGGIFFKPLEAWTPAALGAGSFLSMIFFFMGSWLMIQDAVGGYENRGFILGFWQYVVISLICLIAGIVNIISLNQGKADKIAATA